MRIELDAVANEYLLETLEAVPESDKPPIARARAVTIALKALIDSGLLRHRYNAKRETDEFRSTQALILQWERDFPELEQVVTPTEVFSVEIGKKTSTFSDCLMML
jgi:hypothetical protein